MTLEQKKNLEDMMSFYSKREAYFINEGKENFAEINTDRVRQIQEVLDVLGYKTKSTYYTTYTCYEISER